MNQQHILLVAVLGLAFSPLIARGADASQSALAAEPDDSGGNSTFKRKVDQVAHESKGSVRAYMHKLFDLALVER